jgi:hypothetical protein
VHSPSLLALKVRKKGLHFGNRLLIVPPQNVHKAASDLLVHELVVLVLDDSKYVAFDCGSSA